MPMQLVNTDTAAQINGIISKAITGISSNESRNNDKHFFFLFPCEDTFNKPKFFKTAQDVLVDLLLSNSAFFQFAGQYLISLQSDFIQQSS